MSQQTLRKTLFRSFVPLLVNCVLVLSISLIAILVLQSHTNKIVSERIPFSEASAEFVLSLDNCIGDLKHWVLTGNVSSGDVRESCDQSLTQRFDVLRRESASEDQAFLLTAEQDLSYLRRSAWQVVDIAHTPGNTPARLIYERDLLPIYHLIQRALGGVGLLGEPHEPKEKVELTIARTHQILSEAVRRLSDALSSGEIYEIREFRRQAATIETLLARLTTQASNTDQKTLVAWLKKEYGVYRSLANQSLDLRQSADWNRALYILQTETEPLAYRLRSGVAHMKIRSASQLRHAAEQSVAITHFVVAGLLVSIVIMGWLAMKSSRSIAGNFDLKIKALSSSAARIGRDDFQPVALGADSPLELTSLARDINQSAKTIHNRTRELQQVISALKTYSQVVSHDIKAPIINMKGYVAVLQETLLGRTSPQVELSPRQSEETQQAIGFLDKAVVQIQQLISRILENSRYLFHDTKYTEVNLSKLIEELLALYTSDLAEAKIKVTAEVTFRSDAFLIEHILINLIDNAIKYTHSDRPLILAIHASLEQDQVTIDVIDNGQGLELEKDLAKLFERGKHQAEGHGIGLALSVSMTKQLGGELSWHNRDDGMGAVFTLRIPVAL